MTFAPSLAVALAACVARFLDADPAIVCGLAAAAILGLLIVPRP